MPDDIIPLFEFDAPAKGEALLSQVVRRNFNALGTTNWTTDASYPAAPQKGMQRILDEAGAGTNIRWQRYDGTAWVDIMTHLETAFTLARRLEFDFTNETVWTVNHGLGARPLVQVLDATHQAIEPTSIVHVQVGGEWNRVVVTHAGNETGIVVCVG
jgi:hypothetical protein